MASSQEVSIESLAAGGDGVGHAADGRVIFVPFTAPGDRVRVRVVAEHRRHLRGMVEELIVPGPGRSDPLCAVFGTCGGCSWQHLDYAAQLEAKQGILRDAIERIARLPLPEPLRVEPSPSPYGYRARARALVRGGRVGFRRRRSHAVCATRRCPILVPELDAALAGLSEAAPARDGDWELTAGSGASVSVHELSGSPSTESVELAVGDDSLRISPGVFVQVNAALRDALATAVWESAGSGGRAIELCAGAGFFTLALARRFESLVAVESDPAAAADLEHNLARAGLSHVELRSQSLESALEELAPAPDLVLLDPPRAGLGPEVADRLARLRARRTVYVSCDPATLARDLAVLADRGHSLTGLRAFDLFPQTPHLESLAVLAYAP